MVITFGDAKEIVRAAEEPGWTVGTYQIEDDGFEDATHFLVVRGAAEAMCDNLDPNFTVAPGLVPLVSKETGRFSMWVAQAEWDRLDAMTPASG